MRQIGTLTIVSAMDKQGQSMFGYYTCPICRKALSQNGRHIRGHMIHHVAKDEMPKNMLHYIDKLVVNQKGINKIIATLSQEDQDYLKDFMFKLKDKSGPDREGSDRLPFNAIKQH